MFISLITIIFLAFIPFQDVFAGSKVAAYGFTSGMNNRHFDYDSTSEHFQTFATLYDWDGTYNTSHYIKVDSEPYTNVSTHSWLNSYSESLIISGCYFSVYLDVSNYAVGPHIYYSILIDHYNGDAEFVRSVTFYRDPDATTVSINMSSLTTTDDRYFNQKPKLQIGSYDVDGLDDGYLQIADWNNTHGSNITTLTNQSITTTYNKEISIDTYDFVTSSSITIGDKFKERSGWSASLVDWDKRLEFNVTNSGSTLYNYAVEIEITTSDGIYAYDLANGDDWRVTDSNGNIKNYWIESYDDSGTSILWFRETPINTGITTFYLYYDNSGASNNEDPTNVFLVWDDFDTGYSDNDPLDTLSRGWIIDGGTPSIQDIGGDSMVAMAFVDDSTGFADSFTNEFGQNISNCEIHYDFWFSDGDTGQLYLNGLEGATSVSLTRIYNDNSMLVFNDASYVEFAPEMDLSLSTWYEFNCLTTTIDFDVFVDDVDYDGVLRNTPTIGLDKFSLTLSDTNAGDLTVYIDNFFVRSFASSEPTINKETEFEGRFIKDNTISLTYVKTSTPSEVGTNYWVNYTAGASCWFNSEITLTLNLSAIILFTGLTETSQYNNFLMNDTIWNYLDQGSFFINITIVDDSTNSYTSSFECFLCETNPSLEVLNPLNGSLHALQDPIGLTYNFTLQISGMTYTEYVYLNGTEKDLETGDSLLLAAAVYYLDVLIIDQSGNSNTSRVWFEVVDYSTVQITYLDTFLNPLNFERFNTYVTTSRFSRYNDLDSYVSLESDDNITIETFNRDGHQLHSDTYSFAERLYIDLSVHFVQWQNNNSYNVNVYVGWTFTEGASEFDNYIYFTLTTNMISSEILIYADAYYLIVYNTTNSNYRPHNIGIIQGSDLIHAKMGINLEKKTSMWNIASSGFSIISTVLTPIVIIIAINEKRKNNKKSFRFLLVGGLLLSFLILGMSGTIAVTLIQYAAVIGVVGLYLLYTFYKDWKKPSGGSNS